MYITVSEMTNLPPFTYSSESFTIQCMYMYINYIVIKILKELNFNPTEIPNNVDIIYGYTLVEYGVFKPKAILNLLREKDIKDYFWKAFNDNSPLQFLNEVKKFLKKKAELKQEIVNSKINLSAELEEFGETFISVAKRSRGKFNYPDWDLDVFPKEFKALILEKTRLFCGRQFVFQEFNQFLQSKSKGYFTVIGDAGMGKSAIASKYILVTKVPCYFNIFAEGKNKPEQFLNSIRNQLIKRYGLINEENSDLRTLLQEASENLPEGEKLIIVVDALDEVDQDGNSNLLDLPQNLPDGVYFFLTRRPYNQDTKRLNLSPDTPYDELDLRENRYQNFSEEDIKDYISLFLKADKDYKNKLKIWLTDRSISEINFVEEVAKKSENNFMYLRYVLPAIANGQYNDLKLTDFPKGLEGYYNSHWDRMNMQGKAKAIEVFILFILMHSKTSPTCEIITEIISKEEEFKNIEELDIEEILEKWIEYVSKETIKGEKRYFIFHKSFQDFLTKKKELKENRKIFAKVKENLNKSIYDDEDINDILD